MARQNRLAGRCAVVTGAGKDIGRATALRLADEGAAVIVVGRRRGPLDETLGMILAQGGRGWAFQADVTQHDQVQAMIAEALAHTQRLDIVVNNAGHRDPTPFLDVSEKMWDEVIATNLKAPFLVSQAAARVMAARGGGVILHTASIDAAGADGTFASYGASKAALLGLNRAMALELAPHGIRVNVVSPGYTESANLGDLVGAEMFARMRSGFDRVPMRRMVQPAEVAAAFAFLASDEASGITGTELRVDCGVTANLFILETLPEAVAGSPRCS